MEDALPCVSPDRRGRLLEALDAFIRRSEARSDLRALALQLQHRLIASPGNASGLAPLLDQSHVARWILVPPNSSLIDLHSLQSPRLHTPSSTLHLQACMLAHAIPLRTQ